jgi:hypothetical protein
VRGAARRDVFIAFLVSGRIVPAVVGLLHGLGGSNRPWYLALLAPALMIARMFLFRGRGRDRRGPWR